MDENMNVDPSMADSILNSVKKMLGIPVDMTDFDIDVLLHINAAIGTLTQLGVGPENGYVVMSSDQTYGDFLGSDAEQFPQVQTFLYLKVRLGWDNSSLSSAVISVMENLLRECEFRLGVTADRIEKEEKEVIVDDGG